MMDWSTSILTLALGFFGASYYFFRKSNKLQQMGVLHIKPWPIVGNLAPAIFRRCSLTELGDRIYKLWNDANYVGFYNMSEPAILIRSPELIKSIAIKSFGHFVDRLRLVDPDLDALFGNILYGRSGEEWKEMRALLTSAFTGSKLKAMFHLMSSRGRSFADHLVNLSTDELGALDTKEAFTKVTNDIIAIYAFGINVDSIKNPDNDFYVFGKKATDVEGLRSVRVFFASNFPKIAKLLNIRIQDESTEKFFQDIVRETIETRDREGIARPDVIQLMMESRGKKPGEGLTLLDMTSQAFSLFAAGFASMATTMSFAAHQIAVNEDIQKKIQEEVDEVIRRTNGEPTYEAVNGMEYLDALINETLRMYPIAPFLNRVCVERFELPPALPGGKPVTIEPGQNVVFPAFSIHRDPKYFPDPNTFDPDRFLGERKKDMYPATYFPFGLGPRMCIGNRFAVLEMKVVLLHLLSKCNFKPSSKALVPLELIDTNFGMEAKGGFWLKLEPRISV